MPSTGMLASSQLPGFCATRRSRLGHTQISLAPVSRAAKLSRGKSGHSPPWSFVQKPRPWCQFSTGSRATISSFVRVAWRRYDFGTTCVSRQRPPLNHIQLHFAQAQRLSPVLGNRSLLQEIVVNPCLNARDAVEATHIAAVPRIDVELDDVPVSGTIVPPTWWILRHVACD